MSRGKKNPSPQELARRLIGKEEHEALEGVKTELLTGTDRSVALVASAMLENSLLLAIRSRFVRMTDVQVHELFYAVNAPLSSFSAKITIAHALGIYGDRYKARLTR
jgi:hypothetical protein